MKPDISLYPKDGDDTESVDNLFEVFEKEYTITKEGGGGGGGDNMDVIRLCKATASMYSRVDIVSMELIV